MRKVPDQERVDAYTELYFREFAQFIPPPEHRVKFKYFRPDLNPVQEQAYDDIAKYSLFHSERGSGKSICALHKMVNHCRTTKNALAILIVLVKRGAEEGGAWHKLMTDVLPIWKAGCGLEWNGPKTNTAKDTFIWITNRFGGWSRILLLSMPVDSFVRDRVKGMEPSFVFIDEAQTLESDAYFKFVVQQLFRRPNAPLQQIVYCANPAGPSHWLYERFFVMPVTDKQGNPKPWDTNYSVYHIPIAENVHNLPAGYYESILEACRDDETEERRMVHGEWVDAPEGDALFADCFIEAKHMLGDVAGSRGIIPVSGFPIQIGYDLGAAHSAVTFEQFLATKEKLLWIVFDEIITTDMYTPYPVLVPRIVKRMDYWIERGGFPFRFEHISDNSAFNQFRATTGSFDFQDVEALSAGRIRMWECPKGPGSVETRVRQTKEKLNDSALYISRTCPKTKEMMLKLPADKENRMTPQKKSRYRHPFDSKTYPHLFYGSTRKNQPTRIQTGKVENLVYSLGNG